MDLRQVRGYYRVNQISKLLKHKVLVWRFYLIHVLKKKSITHNRVLIFAQGRTGSTLLESLLASTGYFISSGELLGHGMSKYVGNPYFYFSGKSKANQSHHFLCHLKIYHLTSDREKAIDPKLFLERLAADGWKIIYLKRDNKLRHVLSSYTVRQRKRYHKTADNKEEIKLNVHEQDIINAIRSRQEYDRLEKIATQDMDVLKIYYEKDLQDANQHQKTVDAILTFLGLEPHKPVSTSLKRINIMPVKDLVLNYEALYSALESEGMLEYIDG